MLFISSRYEYNDNTISFIKDLTFVKTSISRSFNSQFFIISKKIISSFFISKNDFDFNFFDNEIRFTSTPRASKKKKILKLEFLNIVEIDINLYYHLIRNKNNKLFFIIISEIYNNLTLNSII